MALKYVSGQRMKNATLCERFGIDPQNAARARLEKRVEKAVQEIVAQYHVELVGLESVDAEVGKAEDKAARLENTARDIGG